MKNKTSLIVREHFSNVSTELKKKVNNIILDQLKQICKEYFDRMYTCESQKYDMEFEVRKRGFEVKRKHEKIPPQSAASRGFNCT